MIAEPLTDADVKSRLASNLRAHMTRTDELPAAKARRTWKSIDGKFAVEASFEWATSDQVAIRKEDGTIVKVAKDKLCADDLAFVEAQRKR